MVTKTYGLIFTISRYAQISKKNCTKVASIKYTQNHKIWRKAENMCKKLENMCKMCTKYAQDMPKCEYFDCKICAKMRKYAYFGGNGKYAQMCANMRSAYSPPLLVVPASTFSGSEYRVGLYPGKITRGKQIPNLGTVFSIAFQAEDRISVIFFPKRSISFT